MKCNFYSYILTFFKNIRKHIFLFFKSFFLAKQLNEVSALKKRCLKCIDDFGRTMHLKQIKIVKLYECRSFELE